MPRTDSVEYEALPLRVFELTEGFPLHDVWLVELEGSRECTIPELRRLLAAERMHSLHPAARALFRIRSVLGKLLGLDGPPERRAGSRLTDSVPAPLAAASLTPPGTTEGPFRVLYVLGDQAAYEALNATVHAILSVALVPTASGQRLLWATHIKPVGRITSLYMGLIDPFRRLVVYPALEAWLTRRWRRGQSAAR